MFLIFMTDDFRVKSVMLLQLIRNLANVFMQVNTLKCWKD